MAGRWRTRLRHLGAGIRTAATHNVPLKALALVIAFGLWAFVNFGERDTEEALKVPIELRNIPASLMITSPRVDFVDVRVVGPRTLLGRIDYTQLRLPLDLNGARVGPAIFTVNTDRLNFPRGVRVVRITPAQITVLLERVRRRTVPVRLQIEGEPPADFRIVQSSLTPAEVEISGPESLLSPIEEAVTEVLRLDDTARATIRRELPLEPLGEYVTARPASVEALVEIEEVMIERKIDAVPVSVTSSSPGERLLDPTTVNLVVRGPRRVVEAVDPSGWVTVAAEGLEPGVHRVDVKLDAPPETEIVAVEPARVLLTVVVPTPDPADAGSTAVATPLAQPAPATPVEIP